MKSTAVCALLVGCFGLLFPLSGLSIPGAARTVQTQGDNTLRIALLTEPDTLDAHKIFIAAEGVVVADLGATLVALAPDTGEPVPYLATDWSVSEDGLRWTFSLRDDVRFHDGTPLTAEEYAWTINRILSLTGPESFVPQALLTNVEEARAAGPYSLELRLRSPDATLLYDLQSAYLQPLLPQAVESAGDDYGRQPVGVGPFRFKEWLPGQRIVLERNPDFTWGPSFTSGGPAQIEQIVYEIIPNNYDLALVQLLDGQVDILNIEHADAGRVQDHGDVVLRPAPAGGSLYLALNVTRAPTDDLRVRQALNHAVDRDQLISIVEYGYGVPQFGPVAPSTIGAWPGAEQAGYPYNPDRSRALLAEAGFTLDDQGRWTKDGERLTLTLLAPTFAVLTQLQQLTSVLADQFAQIGIDVVIVPVDPTDLLASRADRASYDLALYGVTWPEATFILLNILHSGGQANIGYVNDPVLDHLLTSSLTSVDPVVGRQWLWDAQQWIIKNAYLVPLYAPPDVVAVNSRVHNVQFFMNNRWLIDAFID